LRPKLGGFFVLPPPNDDERDVFEVLVRQVEGVTTEVGVVDLTDVEDLPGYRGRGRAGGKGDG
jgi:hypothetical protein